MDNLKDMHWSQLKKLVEEKGGKYESKDQAVAFLSGDEPKAGDEQNNGEAPKKVVDADGKPVFSHARPHGHIFGVMEDMPGARFVQDGHYFNGQHEHVGSED